MTFGLYDSTERKFSSRRGFPAALAVSALGLGTKSGVAGASPAFCNTSYDPYKVSDAVRAACGIRSYPLQSVHTDRSGTSYSFDVQGSTYTFKTPAPGFDPKTASEAERDRYGIPHEPAATDLIARLRWDALVSKLHWPKPPRELVTTPHAFATASSADWSGYVGEVPSGDSYYLAAQTYDEPTTYSTPCSNNSAVFFSGLGGGEQAFGTKGNFPNLAQDGTAINTPGLGQNQAWLEILPDAAMPIPYVYGTPGAPFAASVEYEGTDSSGRNTFEFYLSDDAGNTATVDVATTHGYDGTTAEVAAERPTSGGSATALTDFGTYQVEAAYAFPREGGNEAETGVNMYNGKNLLASVSPPTSTGDPPTHDPLDQGQFAVAWHGCS